MVAEIDRVEKLRAMLDRSPGDPFLLYALGMEFKKTDAAKAVELFDQVILHDPGYCYAYYQKGQVHESAGDVETARQAYRDGVAAATKKGDQHARDELTAALEMIE